MANSPQPSEDNTPQALDIASVLLAIWFVISVISNARDLVDFNSKNAPASYALISSLLLVAARTYQNERKIPLAGYIVIAMLLTAGAIWLFGLSA